MFLITFSAVRCKMSESCTWLYLYVLSFVSVYGNEMAVQEKADAAIPLPSYSPPEGNTTFLGGTTWCVAAPGASQADLQNALDWACGLGMADCRPIQTGGSCFNPDTLLSHASYAFNYYYQQNGNSDIACNFGGTAALTKTDPSYDKCIYTTSGSLGSAAPEMPKHRQLHQPLWAICVLMLLLHGRRY
uniref:X8 domain-containing protein n=1 Tax=Kalanchoe fedtschenkoi TaxID=63787 RepID=A0A7N0U2I0_KALFE